jgi:hypothetical protein
MNQTKLLDSRRKASKHHKKVFHKIIVTHMSRIQKNLVCAIRQSMENNHIENKHIACLYKYTSRITIKNEIQYIIAAIN